jgi:hypothetical protein
MEWGRERFEVTPDTFVGYFPYGSCANQVTGASMAIAQSTQGGAAKAPPIPTMDVSPPPPATASQIRQQVRDMAKQARAAAQDARNAAKNAQKTGQDAQKTVQIPSPAGGPTTTTTSPAFNPNDVIPPQVWDVTFAFFFTVAFCVVGLPIARAFARRLDRKTEFKSVAAPDVTPHIRQLQDSVDAMAIELERISEGQRFTAKLLADRSGGVGQQQ